MSSYIDHHSWPRVGSEQQVQTIHSWRDHTRRALIWQYGPERAHAIELGTDTRTNADLRAWRSLGSSERGAA